MENGASGLDRTHYIGRNEDSTKQEPHGCFRERPTIVHTSSAMVAQRNAEDPRGAEKPYNARAKSNMRPEVIFASSSPPMIFW